MFNVNFNKLSNLLDPHLGLEPAQLSDKLNHATRHRSKKFKKQAESIRLIITW